MPLPKNDPCTADEMATALGVSAETVKDWIVKYNLPAVRPGSVTIIPDPMAFYAAMPSFNAEPVIPSRIGRRPKIKVRAPLDGLKPAK